MLYTCNLHDIVPQLCFNKIKQGLFFFLKKKAVWSSGKAQNHKE